MAVGENEQHEALIFYNTLREPEHVIESYDNVKIKIINALEWTNSWLYKPRSSLRVTNDVISILLIVAASKMKKQGNLNIINF